MIKLYSNGIIPSLSNLDDIRLIKYSNECLQLIVNYRDKMDAYSITQAFLDIQSFLGWVCRFSSVTERFFNELNARRIDTNIARSETLSIINGMRYLRLGVCVKSKYSLEMFYGDWCKHVLFLRSKQRVD